MSSIDILGLRTNEKFLKLEYKPQLTAKIKKSPCTNRHIKKVFKTCSRIFHPDKIANANARFEAQETFQRIHQNCLIFENHLTRVGSITPQYIFLSFGDEGIRLYESEKERFAFILEATESSAMTYAHFCWTFGNYISDSLLDLKLRLAIPAKLNKKTNAENLVNRKPKIKLE